MMTSPLFLCFNVYYFTINSLWSAVCGLRSAVCSLQMSHPVCSEGPFKGIKIPYNFLKGIFTTNFRDMGNVRPSVFGLIKMLFRVPKKGQLTFSERK